MNNRTLPRNYVFQVALVAAITAWMTTSTASFAATSAAATATSAITIPEAMRSNLNLQTQAIEFSRQVPVTQGMVDHQRRIKQSSQHAGFSTG